MVAKRKKKFESGAGVRYITRKEAMKKLQLTLKDFRRLCILKGIYPREPSNRKKAQKGKTGIKTLYHRKDIQFLLHEPIIWKLRDYKIFARKVGRARAVRDFEALDRHLKNHPELKLDHIVKERYPTFIDAVRDLDDCLSLCFLFSTFPSLNHVRRDLSNLCRRLSLEFMHYVIAAKALRKVFVSIKGFYYQADIFGQTVTWITPHNFPYKPESRDDVDFRIMATFVDFYTIMLGFTNFKLFNSINLYYPPAFNSSSTDAQNRCLVDEDAFVSERVAALTVPLSRTEDFVAEEEDEELEIDNIPLTDDPEKVAEMRQEREKIKKLKTLFKGLHVFVNREVPREPVVFVLRCFGAKVSWDPLLFVGSAFEETDSKITHQIVDRPSMPNTYLSRFYVQPQWVFDCVNARKLLPESDYLMGKVLPPHLSPFTTGRPGQYQPPEEKALRDGVELGEGAEDEEKSSSESESEEEQEGDDVNEDSDLSQDESNEASESESGDNEEVQVKQKIKKMKVKQGEVVKEDPSQKINEEKAQLKLRERMIARKHRKLYQSMMKGRRKRNTEANLLKKKREDIDAKKKTEKKANKKKMK